MSVIISFLILLLSLNSVASTTVVKGYKDKIYEVNERDLCEYDHFYQQQWCIDTGIKPIGVYIGFKQFFVYSKDRLVALNIIKKDIKWEIPLKKVFKLHMNYPVIILLSTDYKMKGYDYFTGFELWSKTLKYENFYGSESDVWLVSKGNLLNLDPLSLEEKQIIPFKEKITKLHGNDVNLFVETTKELYHFNRITLKKKLIGDQWKIIDKSSDFLLIGDDSEKKLVSFENEEVSKNVQVELEKIETSSKSYFAHLGKESIHLITKSGQIGFQISSTKNIEKINYAYKIGNKLRVFYNGKQDVWELKRIKKKLSGQDT